MSSNNPFFKRTARINAMKKLRPKTRDEAKRRAALESLNQECPECKRSIAPSILESNDYICHECGYLFKMPSDARLKSIMDGDYEEMDARLVGNNPLNFPGYAKKLESNAASSGLSEAVRCVIGKIGDIKAVVCVLDSRFMMGSMGVAVGEKITRAVERATMERLPLVIFSASGGARMQEGIFSLMQMAKTSAAIAKHSDAGLFYISVLTNPTTGGVTASFASLGDVILAEPKALIGFAGPRVIEQTIRQQLPEGFQRAEYLLEHGFVDRIVKRENLRDEIALLLMMHSTDEKEKRAQVFEAKKREISGVAGTVDPASIAEANEEHAKEIDNPATSLGASGDGTTSNNILCGEDSSENSREDSSSGVLEKSAAAKDSSSKNVKNANSNDTDAASTNHFAGNPIAKGLRDIWGQLSTPPAKRVELARASERPHADFFIQELFHNFLEMHGDRLDYDDESIKAGIAYFHDVPVTVIAQCKGSTLEENLKYNFGMPNPQGYRKAMRLAKQADKFGRPIITIIDTPGAYPGIEAEAKGQGEAIARSIELFSTLKVPIIALFIGEGGSGGALALGVANSIIMLENSIYSILSPEGFASILWKDSSRSREAAGVMKLTSYDIAAFGIADAIISEGSEPLKAPCPEIITKIDSVLVDEILKLAPKDGDTLAEERYEKYRKIGKTLNKREDRQ